MPGLSDWNSQMQKRLPATIAFLLCILLVLLGILFGLAMLDLVELDGLLGVRDSKSQVLSFIGVTMGGILVALNAVMSYRRAKALEDAVRVQANEMLEQADANKMIELGRRQERLRTAIGHLGSDSAAVRMGGAYELCRLVSDDTKNMRQAALKILCTHIRHTTLSKDYRKVHKNGPSLEIQDLLTLILVQEAKIFEGLNVVLNGSWLRGADLRQAKMLRANLRHVELSRALLDGALLDRADLTQARLRDASLCDASLRETELLEVRMETCDLARAKLQGANIRAGRLAAGNLARAELQGADLSKAWLHGATLTGAKLQGARLSSTKLHGAQLDGAVFSGAVVKWTADTPFAERMLQSAEKKSDLAGVYSTDLDDEVARRLINKIRNISKSEGKELMARLRPCIRNPRPEPGLPEGSGATAGVYTRDQAEEWIAEHYNALRATQDVQHVGRQLPTPENGDSTKRLVPGERAGDEVG